MLSISPLLVLAAPNDTALPAVQRALRIVPAEATVQVARLPGAPPTPNRWASASVFNDPRVERLTLGVAEAPLEAQRAAVKQHVADASVRLVALSTPPDRGAIPPLDCSLVQWAAFQLPVSLLVERRVEAVPPLQQLVVPVDFSKHARAALRCAQALAETAQCRPSLMHVIERPQYVALNEMDLLALSDPTIAERQARRRAAALTRTALGVDGDALAFHLAHGDAASEIARFVQEHPVDLLVMATHGLINRSRRPLGHVVEKVLRRVVRSVLLVRTGGPPLVPEAMAALNAVDER
ncbi:universal stress protein [Salisaeta longa]|uniref:universal stress protein n=1 Tax=Salisaeta longa TaxID=503170 RepID=UPI0003B3D076|nr:universal stress protein [Salisaeta longa]